jgi:hypothetical protein
MAKKIKDCWKILSLSTAILLVQMSGGCVPQKQVRSSSTPPIIDSFRIEPPSMIAGSACTLQWRTRNAESAHIIGIGPDPVKVGLNGTKTVTVEAGQVFILTVTGHGGESVSESRGIQVTIKSGNFLNTKPIALSYLKAYLKSPKFNANLANVSKKSKKLPSPRMKSPKNGAVYSRYPRSIKLSWNSVKGAVQYGVEIDCYDCCKAKRWCADVGKPHKIVNSISGTSYKFNFVGAKPGRWRVWAIDSKGQPGAKSAWRSFRFTR